MYFDILNILGVAYECDRWMDTQNVGSSTF